jgi:hypothetical protein
MIFFKIPLCDIEKNVGYLLIRINKKDNNKTIEKKKEEFCNEKTKEVNYLRSQHHPHIFHLYTPQCVREFRHRYNYKLFHLLNGLC